MKTLLKLLYLFLVYTINIYAQVITVNGIKLPSGSDATQHQADELAIGGPSSDFATLTFPFAGATTCTSASPVPTTINQEIDTYGKTILLVTSPSDCPYCRNAAFSVNNAIIARLPNIRLWYAASKLAGATSDCDEITNQKADIPFLANAHFTFMDAYWWDNTMQRAHHNASGSSYLMAPELPSSYRIIDPITRKVTSLGYYLDENALDAAIAKNFTPGGSITVNPSTLNFAASASGLNFSITGNGAWTISDNAAWLTVSSTTGTGNRTVIANVAANLNTVSRNATISIVGSNVTRIISVSQAGATPIFMLTPQTLNYAATGSLLNISLTSNMSWSASGAPAWVSLSTLSGIGSAVVGVNAGTNLGVNIRTGSITFSAGSSSLIVNITQTGAMPQLTVNPTSVNPPQAGNSTTISVTSNINWSVSENATWLSTSVTNGNGNNTFNAVASANATIFSRSETITVSGSGINRTIVVSQAGLTPSLIVSPTSLAYSAGASVQNVTVTSNLPTWTVAKSETWITLNVNSGSNNGNINVSAL